MVRLTDHPDMTLDVYCGRKTTMQQQQQQTGIEEGLYFFTNYLSRSEFEFESWAELTDLQICPQFFFFAYYYTVHDFYLNLLPSSQKLVSILTVTRMQTINKQ